MNVQEKKQGRPKSREYIKREYTIHAISNVSHFEFSCCLPSPSFQLSNGSCSFLISQLLLGSSSLLQRLVKVIFDVVQVLDTHRDPNHIRRYPTPFLLRLGELLVRGGSRVND